MNRNFALHNVEFFWHNHESQAKLKLLMWNCEWCHLCDSHSKWRFPCRNMTVPKFWWKNHVELQQCLEFGVTKFLSFLPVSRERATDWWNFEFADIVVASYLDLFYFDFWCAHFSCHLGCYSWRNDCVAPSIYSEHANGSIVWCNFLLVYLSHMLHMVLACTFGLLLHLLTSNLQRVKFLSHERYLTLLSISIDQ